MSLINNDRCKLFKFFGVFCNDHILPLSEINIIMMTRILTICCILLAAAGFAVIAVNPVVAIKSAAPQLVNPGDEFMVRIRIDKAELKKGAVFQQVLPAGFSASAILTDEAKFNFENQMVRFVWDNLPAKNSLIIAYKVKADDQTTGIKNINGTFIYEQNGKTAQLNLPANIIYVTNDYPITNAGASEENIGALRINRIVESKKGEQSNGYRITINVSNHQESGFATWIEQIPADYPIEINAANNGTFSREGSLVKFRWTTLPEENEWAFSYTISPPDNSTMLEKQELVGIMVYGNPDSPKSFIPENGIIPGSSVETNIAVKVPETITAPIPEIIEEKITHEVPEKINEEVTQNESTQESTQTASSGNAMMLSVQRGIYYRVQIAATKRSPVRDSNFFQSRFNIERPVDMVEQDGWRKYCIGTFARIEPAKTFAFETRSHIPDAFVVAYRDGQRIPVAEAMETLSISQ